MKIVKDQSLKPFGSGTSCIDALGGDCIRNISLEDCIKISEKSNQSQCGMHVEVPGSALSSYCIPLNNDSWTNLDLAPNLIQTKNNSFLSTSNGVNTTFFYDEQTYKTPDPDTFTKMIFDFDIIQLKYRDVDGTVLTMDEGFKFVPKTDFDMLFRSYWNIQYGKVHRCTSGGKYQFFRGSQSEDMHIQTPYERFEWENFNLTFAYDNYSKFFVECVDKNALFIDSNAPIYIFHQNTRKDPKMYLYVDPKTKSLKIDRGGNKKSVFYLFKSYDLPNVYPDTLYKKISGSTTKNMEIYLEKFKNQDIVFSDYTPKAVVVNEYNYPWLWTSVAVLGLLLLTNIIVYVHNVRRKYKMT